MQTPVSSPPFSAILFSLSGCLVDFGARTAPSPCNAFIRQHVPRKTYRMPLAVNRAQRNGELTNKNCARWLKRMQKPWAPLCPC